MGEKDKNKQFVALANMVRMYSIIIVYFMKKLTVHVELAVKFHLLDYSHLFIPCWMRRFVYRIGKSKRCAWKFLLHTLYFEGQQLKQLKKIMNEICKEKSNRNQQKRDKF